MHHSALSALLIKQANGGVMKVIMTKCYNLTRTEKREDPESLTFIDGVLNIDTQTIKGLANARSNKILDRRIVDVFATSYFLEGMMLFNANNKGRAFTILQHPVVRAESLYLSRDASLEELTFSEYIESKEYFDNWVVRSLTNNKRGELTEDHLLVAKGILARKFLIGIAEYFEESIKRLEMYFEWNQPQEGCAQKFINNNQDTIAHIERGGNDWQLVTEKDKYDLMLYYYALEVFAKQGSTMFNRPYVDKSGNVVNFQEVRKKEMLKKERLKKKFLSLIGKRRV